MQSIRLNPSNHPRDEYLLKNQLHQSTAHQSISSSLHHTSLSKEYPVRNNVERQSVGSRIEDQLRHLQTQLAEYAQINHRTTEVNKTYENEFKRIKELIYEKLRNNYELRTEEVAYQLQKILFPDLHRQKPSENQYQFIIKQQDQKIKELQNLLLSSIQNNIHGIFHTQLSSQEVLQRQLASLKREVANIRRQNQFQPNLHRREEDVSNLRDAEKQLKKKQQIIQQLKQNQRQLHKDFQDLKRELSSRVQFNYRRKFDQRLKILQQRFSKAIQDMKLPQKLQPEISTQEYQNEIDNLNKIINEKQSFIELLKSINLELQTKIRSLQSHQVKSIQSSLIENIKKQKYKHQQLKRSHNNRQVEFNLNVKQNKSQKNAKIKNYEEAIQNLRDQISYLQNRLKNRSEGGVERVQTDESVENILNEILLILINEKDHNSCLEKLVIMIMENYPAFQEILENYGLIQHYHESQLRGTQNYHNQGEDAMIERTQP